MTSTNIYHYVYRITNIVENKHYYGKRSSKIEPKLDIGKKYFSSSSDKQFMQDQKQNPQNYKYKIVRITDTDEAARILEIKLHKKFNVAKSDRFYNLAVQDSPMFGKSNCVIAKDKNNNRFIVKLDDPRWISGEIVGERKGFVVVKDLNGDCFSVRIDNSKYLSGEYKHVASGRSGSEKQKKAASAKSKNTVPVVDINGKTFRVSVHNQKYKSGEYKHSGTKLVLINYKGSNIWVNEYDSTIDFSRTKIIWRSKRNKSKKKYIFYTPWGNYSTVTDAYAAKPINIHLTIGNIKKYCQSDIILERYNRSNLYAIFGEYGNNKTTKELGFWREIIK